MYNGGIIIVPSSHGHCEAEMSEYLPSVRMWSGTE